MLISHNRFLDPFSWAFSGSELSWQGWRNGHQQRPQLQLCSISYYLSLAMCSVGLILMTILGGVAVGLLLVAIAGGVSLTATLVLPILLLYGLWKIWKFIVQTIFPFGYPLPDLQPSAPGPHPPLQPAGHSYLFRLDRFEAVEVPQ